MPSMANITVKKNDGTTDIVYTALVPSAGDKSAARWKSNSVSVIPKHRPELAMTSQSNGAKDVRRVRTLFTYPAVATISGVETLLGTHVIDTTYHLVQGVDEASINEAVSQQGNLAVSALVKDSAKAGYAPT